jgi:hypothetical protein
VPAVTVQLTEQLLELATERAEQLGKSLDELYAEAIRRSRLTPSECSPSA